MMWFIQKDWALKLLQPHIRCLVAGLALLFWRCWTDLHASQTSQQYCPELAESLQEHLQFLKFYNSPSSVRNRQRHAAHTSLDTQKRPFNARNDTAKSNSIHDDDIVYQLSLRIVHCLLCFRLFLHIFVCTRLFTMLDLSSLYNVIRSSDRKGV